MPPRENRGIDRRSTAPLDQFKELSEERHNDNLKRFGELENKIAYIKGELQVIIVLLIANGALQFYVHS